MKSNDKVVVKEVYSNTIKFLVEPDDEDYLWRYLDLSKFLSFIIDKKLHLSRFDQLEDVHEGAPVENLMKRLALSKIEKDGNKPFEALALKMAINLTDGLLDWSRKAETKLYQHLYYTNCWFIGKRESMAMWSTYGNKDSVAIKVKYRDLKEAILNNQGHILELEGFHELRVGKVRYIDFINLDEHIAEVHDKIEIGFTKDISYKHENEFRICLIKSDPNKIWKKYKDEKKWLVRDQEELLAHKGLSYKLNDLDKLPFEVLFHPKADDFSKSNIKNLLKKFELPFKTYDSEIKLR